MHRVVTLRLPQARAPVATLSANTTPAKAASNLLIVQIPSRVLKSRPMQVLGHGQYLRRPSGSLLPRPAEGSGGWRGAWPWSPYLGRQDLHTGRPRGIGEVLV